MPFAVCTNTTYAKAKTIFSGDLSDDQKLQMKPKQKIGFLSLEPAESNHIELVLAGNMGPFSNKGKVFIYAPDWEMPKDLIVDWLSLIHI